MKCDYFKNNKCSSCNLLEKSYSESLLIKEAELKALFPHHVSLMKPTVELSGEISGSRNKAKLAVFSHDNKLTFGFYQQDGVSRELEKCPLHAEGINAFLPNIREILNKHKIIPYDIKLKTGELKYLLISTSRDEDNHEFLLRFVLRSKESLHRLKKAADEILSLSSSIKVITANIQPIHQAIIEGDEEILLTNNSVIIHAFDEFKLALGVRSFFQVTPEIAKSLYNAVADSIAIDSPTSLIDLYCGVGVFSFYASRHCSDVTGVEISKEAIDCANHSKHINKVNANFVAMDVEAFLKTNNKNFEAVLVNPPRRGLNTSIINMIKSCEPQFIYYSSCNAQTMYRDFKELEDLYEIKSLQLFDMFPYTSHYETLMCLVKKSCGGMEARLK
jgi:23S rRNA (uracil747-C5)-methyltransferase